MRLTGELIYRVLILLLLAVASAKCQSSVNYRLSKSVAPTAYDLHITVDLENLMFNGTETILVHANQPTSTIEVHLLDLSVDNVQVIEGENAIGVASLDYSSATEIYRITLSQNLSVDREYKVKMNFRGEIKDDMKGLYRSKYYENAALK